MWTSFTIVEMRMLLLTKKVMILMTVCLLGTHGKPSLSFNLHPFSMFGGSTAHHDDDDDVVKAYSGRRVANESVRMVYFHEQTVGVIELAAKKLLLGCEFIEVYKEKDAFKLLRRLQNISQPLHINFDEMLDLMSQCSEVEAMKPRTKVSQRSKSIGRGIFSNNPFTLLNGIIPGTKWCGTGDIADQYHDLGAETDVDRCCRTHDLCPVKIRAYANRYNITNKSYYTKTHCACDDRLFDCLKQYSVPTAHLLGQVYFNLVQVPCLGVDESGAMAFRPTEHRF